MGIFKLFIVIADLEASIMGSMVKHLLRDYDAGIGYGGYQ